MHKIYWCEGGLKLAGIGTKNGSENDLNPKMKFKGLTTDTENFYKRGDII